MQIIFKNTKGHFFCVHVEGGPSANERVLEGIRAIDPNAVVEPSKRMTVTLAELLNTAKMLNEPVEPEAEEYRRGQLALIATLFGTEGVPSDERMDELASMLGWPNLG